MADEKAALVALEYIGNGRWIPGVPASDIEATESDAARLVASRMYRVKGGK